MPRKPLGLRGARHPKLEVKARSLETGTPCIREKDVAKRCSSLLRRVPPFFEGLRVFLRIGETGSAPFFLATSSFFGQTPGI
jgi:hypothetical protein